MHFFRDQDKIKEFLNNLLMESESEDVEFKHASETLIMAPLNETTKEIISVQKKKCNACMPMRMIQHQPTAEY